MAHYAFLDMANVVTEVIVGKDEGDTNTNWELQYQDVRNKFVKELLTIQVVVYTQVMALHIEKTTQV